MIARRTWAEAKRDNISIIAAGVAFQGFLAIFPALAALVAIYGLVLDPSDVQRQVAELRGVLPSEALSILEGQLLEVAQGGGEALGFGLILSLLLALWSANKGTKALLTALDIAYDEEEKRGPIRFNLVSLAFTGGVILMVLLMLGLVAILPGVLGAVGLESAARTAIAALRWPAIAALAFFALAALYRYGPSRDEPRWRWASPGAILAVALWLLGSAAFSLYASKLGSFNETYGSLGAVVILLLWFYLTAYAVLLGGELNSQVEHRS